MVEVPSRGSCWGGVFGQIFLDEPSPLFFLLLRFTDTSMFCSYGSAMVGFFLFFFLAGGVGEEAAGLFTFGGSTGVGSGSTGVSSGTDDFTWLGFFLLEEKGQLLSEGSLFLLLPGDLLPTFIIFIWLLALLGYLLCCCCGCCNCCSGGCGSDWLLSLRAELCDAAKLFATPTARPSAINHYHHLSVPACDYFRNGLKSLPRQAQPEYVLAVCSPGS